MSSRAAIIDNSYASSSRPPEDKKYDSESVIVTYRTLSHEVSNEAHSPKEKGERNKVKDPFAALKEISVHTLSTNQLFSLLSTHPTLGLEQAAIERLKQSGKTNVISSPPSRLFQKFLFNVFGGFNFLMWIAFVLTVLSYQPLGGSSPQVFNLGVAVLLFLVIVVSACFYTVVDWNSSKIMDSIKDLIASSSTVIRNGNEAIIPSKDILVGDLVVLAMGDIVPADLAIVRATADAKFDRSLLTGESVPVPASTKMTNINPFETRNLALSSTYMVEGSAVGVCFAIGDDTVMGRIIGLTAKKKEQLTPIQRELNIFTVIISIVAGSFFILSMILYFAWIQSAYPGYLTVSEAIVNSIGCLTAFVPQSLPICVALALTFAAKKMAEKKVLVKNLTSVETLGCMSVLCSDKTGTLTKGQMSVELFGSLGSAVELRKVEKFESNLNEMQKEIVKIAAICNDSTAVLTDGGLSLKGNATDVACYRLAADFNLDGHFRDSFKKIGKIPFNSKNKWMLTLVQRSNKPTDLEILVKGAPDYLIKACDKIMELDGSVSKLKETDRRGVLELQEKWSSQGFRVLLVAKKVLDVEISKIPTDDPNKLESYLSDEVDSLTIVGLLGIFDPPRDNVPFTIGKMKEAGIRVFMVTGDHNATAISIAKQTNILTSQNIERLTEGLRKNHTWWSNYQVSNLSDMKPDPEAPIRSLVITGDEIASISKSEWNAIVGQFHEIVFARTTPEQKCLIVKEIKIRGDNVVGATGDGVNDCPALKAADIGIAMGAGSDVAKEAAVMVLMSNDFSSLLDGISNGRLVFENLKKVLILLMPVGTYVEFMAVLANVVFGMQIALSSYLQVCFCVTNDVAISIALMQESAESDLMKKKPRNSKRDVLTDWKFFVNVYFFYGLMAWPCAMGMWFFYWQLQGIGFYQLMFQFNAWGNNQGLYSADELNYFVSVGQCCYYVCMVIMQFGNVIAMRNRNCSFLESNFLSGPRKNWAIPIAICCSILIAVINLYGPGLQFVFATAPIPAQFWFIPMTFAVGILSLDEIRKLVIRKFPTSFVAKAAW